MLPGATSSMFPARAASTGQGTAAEVMGRPGGRRSLLLAGTGKTLSNVLPATRSSNHSPSSPVVVLTLWHAAARSSPVWTGAAIACLAAVQEYLCLHALFACAGTSSPALSFREREERPPEVQEVLRHPSQSHCCRSRSPLNVEHDAIYPRCYLCVPLAVLLGRLATNLPDSGPRAEHPSAPRRFAGQLEVPIRRRRPWRPKPPSSVECYRRAEKRPE